MGRLLDHTRDRPHTELPHFTLFYKNNKKNIEHMKYMSQEQLLSVAAEMSEHTERAKTALIPPHPPCCVGLFCLGSHGGQDLEKLVFLGPASPLVRRRVSGRNVNTRAREGWDVSASARGKTEDAQPRI